jgi:hypothetical protein
VGYLLDAPPPQGRPSHERKVLGFRQTRLGLAFVRLRHIHERDLLATLFPRLDHNGRLVILLYPHDVGGTGGRAD